MSHARNLGAEITAHEPDPATVLVFNDADSIIPHRQILEAVHQASVAPGLVYAYDLYLRLDEAGRVEQELFAPPSMGCAAISRDSFWEAGGFDQRFVGWGYEDVEFAQRCASRWPVRRVSGVLEHLWHGARNSDDSPADADPELVERNRLLWAPPSVPSTV
jgi:GT2 family glycosyltransferase